MSDIQNPIHVAAETTIALVATQPEVTAVAPANEVTADQTENQPQAQQKCDGIQKKDEGRGCASGCACE
ncbi:hypothetical protein IAR55_000284 [Kwoniella newhampshirensis]|uniref:Uncharacterized protein n=1 Tax=Kwoniella newhampshirensis TaxID=1651941 RepID=A0AAW0Z6N1_9TREE